MKLVSGQVLVCRYGCGIWYNTTSTFQKLGFCQAIATKYIGRPPHAHWDLRIIHPLLEHIRAEYQTLEVHLFKADSTRDTISKGGDITNAEPMESKVTNVTGTV